MKLLIILLLLGIYWTNDLEGSNVSKIDEVGLKYYCSYCQPEQIHISFGEKTNDIVVTWSTFNDSLESCVQYGVGVLDQEASGSSNLFVDGGKLARSQYIHVVTLKDLKFNTTYVYHAGSVYGWSEVFSFRTTPEGENWPVRAAIYGDLGSENAHSLSYLQGETERNNFDLIIHVGDFAYDMDTNNALVGDEFMRQIQPIAAYVPYMTCPGNHEHMYNFSNYANRFSMPGPTPSLFYSFDIGPIHFVSISTEVYYFTEFGMDLIAHQYEWLKKDLQEAKNHRFKRPWIIMFGHRPMYCSNEDYNCEGEEYTKTGLGGKWALEPLLHEADVDLVIWAHKHSYERSFPLYENNVLNGSYEQPYVNPGGPVHIVTGAAGCKERTAAFQNDQPEWSAFRSRDYGYMRFVAHNKSHIYTEQVSVDLNGEVIDSMWLVKDRDRAYDIK